MADAPDLQGLRPFPKEEAEEAEERVPSQRYQRSGGSPYIRPRHTPMNCYPTAETKQEFEERVDDLATEFRKSHGRKIPNGAIHEAALTFVLENWDTIAEPFRK